MCLLLDLPLRSWGCSAAPSTREPLTQPRRAQEFSLRDHSDVIYTTATSPAFLSSTQRASFPGPSNTDRIRAQRSRATSICMTRGQAAQSPRCGRLSHAIHSARGIKCALAQSLQPSARITEQRFLVCIRQKITPDDPRILPSPVVYSKGSVLLTARVPGADTAAQVPPPGPEESRQNPAPRCSPARRTSPEIYREFRKHSCFFQPGPICNFASCKRRARQKQTEGLEVWELGKGLE